MKKILPFITLLLLSCSTENKKTENAVGKKEVKTETSEASESPTETTTPERKTSEKKDYYGSFFKVSYPQDFRPAPDGPKAKYPEGDQEYIETDEAVFTAPDGVVQFYVYSPQWGGNCSWEEAMENEKLIDSKSNEQEQEVGGVTTTTYLTFEAKDHSYTRSVFIQTTETTKKAFGVKYPNTETYNLYKPEYVEFKKSLVQYAD
ncbi:MAG: hypothetical protein KDC84_14355 [Crocinitomicaceae bacterium]|nr:hypothetical protein [Crocinitomicaceae bacterium]